MADKAKTTEDKGSTSGKSKYTATRTARIGSKKDGSPKISTQRGKDMFLTKEEADDYRKYNLI